MAGLQAVGLLVRVWFFVDYRYACQAHGGRILIPGGLFVLIMRGLVTGIKNYDDRTPLLAASRWFRRFSRDYPAVRPFAGMGIDKVWPCRRYYDVRVSITRGTYSGHV